MRSNALEINLLGIEISYLDLKHSRQEKKFHIGNPPQLRLQLA